MSLSSIGKTLGDTSATIITGQEDLRLLPRGALGELCFGSSQLVSLAESLNICEANKITGPCCFWVKGYF